MICRDDDMKGGLAATFFCWMLPVLQLYQEVGHRNVLYRHFYKVKACLTFPGR